jgi:hypothetical protein
MSDQDLSLEKLVSEAASRLAEHCDSVRIFVSWHDDETAGYTKAFSEGRGNVFAQLGQIREWLIIRKEEAACKARDDYAADKNNESGESEEEE